MGFRNLLIIFLSSFTLICYAEISVVTFADVADKRNNYLFDLALNNLEKIQEDYDVLLLKKDFIKLQLILFNGKVISETKIIQLKEKIKSLKMLYEKRENKTETSYLSLMLNDLIVLELINLEYYQKYLGYTSNIDLLSAYNNPQEPDDFSPHYRIVSYDLIHIYSYLLYINDYKKESIDLLNCIYNSEGFTTTEREYLYNLQLVFYSYIEKDFLKGQEYLNMIIDKDVDPDYYYYVKPILYLWQSLIHYRNNILDKSVSSYKVFVEMKKDIDTDYIVPIRELLSPVPGVFPPEFIYKDLEHIQKLYLEFQNDD